MAHRPKLSKEAFLSIAAQNGLNTDDAHMEALYPEVAGLLQRLSIIDDIDTSKFDPITIFTLSGQDI